LINFTSCPLPGQDAFPVPEVSGVKVWLDAGITIERFAELPSTGGRGLAESGVDTGGPGLEDIVKTCEKYVRSEFIDVQVFFFGGALRFHIVFLISNIFVGEDKNCWMGHRR
jgi:hypothetical protein